MSLLPADGQPLGLIPSIFRRQKPRDIADMLEGATISRLRYLADLGMYGGTQFLLELRDHRIAIFMSGPGRRDSLGTPVGEYAWVLALQMMKKRLLVPKSIETRMRESREVMGDEAPPDAIQKRVEGQTILRVPESKHPIAPYASKAIKLELSGGVDFYIFAMPPRWLIEGRPPTPVQAEFHLETLEGDRKLVSTPTGLLA